MFETSHGCNGSVRTDGARWSKHPMVRRPELADGWRRMAGTYRGCDRIVWTYDAGPVDRTDGAGWPKHPTGVMGACGHMAPDRTETGCRNLMCDGSMMEACGQMARNGRVVRTCSADQMARNGRNIRADRWRPMVETSYGCEGGARTDGAGWSKHPMDVMRAC